MVLIFKFVCSEDALEDGRALVSPTSINVVSTYKALSIQIEETPIANADEYGNLCPMIQRKKEKNRHSLVNVGDIGKL